MKKLLLSLILLVCAVTPAYAWGPYWGPGPCGWRGGYWGPGGRAAFWTGFGLTCGAMVLGTAAAYANPPVVYASPTYVAPAVAPVVYTQPAVVYAQPTTQVVYTQPAQSNIVYVQAPPAQTTVVQQPAPQTTVVQAPAPQQTVVQAPAPQQQTVVAQAPVQQSEMAAQPPAASMSYAVFFQNKNGSTSVIPLTPSGTGWLGPQGEYYPSYPTSEQIKARYQ